MSLYLSRLPLNVRSRQARSELSRPYEMHRTLSKAFDEGAAQQEARCLFRTEDGADDRSPSVLVQSRVAPDWSRLTISKDYLAGSPMTKAVTLQVAEGVALAFRLRANPTVVRNGVRRGLYQEEEQLAWLARKGTLCGFEVCSVETRALPPVRSPRGSGKDAVLCAVQFEGTIRVSDATMLVTSLENGIGAGKGFGFGLLSLARR